MEEEDAVQELNQGKEDERNTDVVDKLEELIDKLQTQQQSTKSMMKMLQEELPQQMMPLSELKEEEVDTLSLEEINMLISGLSTEEQRILDLGGQLTMLRHRVSNSISLSESPKGVGVRVCQYPLFSDYYDLQDEISDGDGVVYKAAVRQTLDSPVVAVKCISRPNFEEVFQRRESLHCHPNVLIPHCCFPVDNSQIWIVMPFMNGGSMKSILSNPFPNGQLEEPYIAALLKQVLNAVVHLHGQGHVHRDIKPGNILVDSDGQVKLADFEVSSVWDYESSSYLPYWVAPEVGEEYPSECSTFMTDVWSFGITALELAHGGPPLSEGSICTYRSMVTKRFPFFHDQTWRHNRKQREDVSKDFEDMVTSCLQEDPSRRPTAKTLLEHPFFNNCEEDSEALVKHMLLRRPSFETRYKLEIQTLQEMPLPDEKDACVYKNGTLISWYLKHQVRDEAKGVLKELVLEARSKPKVQEAKDVQGIMPS